MDRLLVGLFAVLAVQMAVMASTGATADSFDARPITLAELCP
jgi:hypothetical protein